MIVPKSRNELHAQVGAYTTERFTSLKDIEKVFKNLGNTTIAHSGADIADPLYADYVTYLRESKKEQATTITERKKLLDNFSNFAPQVEELFSEFASNDSLEARKNNPKYIGSGTISDVFAITHNNMKYVVKIPRNFEIETFTFNESPNPAGVEDYATAAIHGRGLPHLEQVVAISYEKGVVIAELMPGIPASELTDDIRAMITDEQLIALAETFKLADENNIVPELENPSNLFYDPDKGFGLIDYDSLDNLTFRTIGFGYSKQGAVFDADCVIHAICSNDADDETIKNFTQKVYVAFGVSLNDVS